MSVAADDDDDKLKCVKFDRVFKNQFVDTLSAVRLKGTFCVEKIQVDAYSFWFFCELKELSFCPCQCQQTSFLYLGQLSLFRLCILNEIEITYYLSVPVSRDILHKNANFLSVEGK